MPDKRRHRGPHPEDAKLFAGPHVPVLRAAVFDLSWLLSRGYGGDSALKLVGDRFQLKQRQRIAVRRSACSDRALARRGARRIEPHQLSGRPLLIDGYNVLTTVEAALAGGVLLVGRDGALRDMASVHGSFRKVAETEPALRRIGEAVAELGPESCTWYLDRPVSNSGRLRGLIVALAERCGWDWQVEVVPSPDRVLAQGCGVVATADSAVLDACGAWVNLARAVAERVPGAWRVAMAG